MDATLLPFSHSSRVQPPQADEFEVSLFGPGFGEGLAVHVGSGRWIVVDSCLTDDGVTPAAVDYFSAIGVNPAEAVSHVIVSHADNDHIGGAAELFSACKTAHLVISAAMAKCEVAAWIAACSQVDQSDLARASTEILTVLETNHRRREVPHRASQDRPIFKDRFCTVTALSPDDKRLDEFYANVAQQLPKAGAPRRRVSELTPNQACVALLVETSFCTAILGADLEERPGKAWTRVVNHSISYKDSNGAVILKVPHHGSKNADCDEVWNRLQQSPIAILATFNRGLKLPSTTDVSRILARTERAFACSSFRKMKAPKERETDKFLDQVNVRRKRRFPRFGQIRVRISQGISPTIELFGGAVHLSRVH